MKKKLLILIFGLFLFFSFKTGVLAADEGLSFEDGTLTFRISPENNTTYVNSGYAPYFATFKDDTKKIVIEGNVDGLGDHLFENFTNLEEVVLPKRMAAEIGDYTFYNCPKLKSINIPIGLSRIGKYAFYGTGITKVDIPIFTSWIDEHAFNDDTVINKLIDSTNLIAAGTGGPMKWLGSANRDEGRPNDNTCYNKFYYNRFYDDNVYWKLDKDGVLTVWGYGEIGAASSRTPWGCYKDLIKKIVLQDEKVGTLTKTNKNNPEETLEGGIYAIYSNEPAEEIFSKKLVLNSTLLFDCRYECSIGFKNLETITVNRGVSEIWNGSFDHVTYPDNPTDIYISKYVEKVDRIIPTYGTIHFGASFEDYKNNGYDYSDAVTENGYNTSNEKIVNDIDKYYVSVNSDIADKEIQYDDKILYLYETYITNEKGAAKIGVHYDENEDYEYYVKEIKAPDGYKLDSKLHKIDMSKDDISLNLSDEPINEEVPIIDDLPIDDSSVLIVDVPNTLKNSSLVIIGLIAVIVAVCFGKVYLLDKNRKKK